MTDFDDVFAFSASQVSKWRGCPRAWGYSYIDNRKTPAGPGAALGSQVHKELENWLTEKVVPDSQIARALTPLLPHPDHKDLLVEQPIRVLFPVGAARGFIDLLVLKPKPEFWPVGWEWSPDIPVVVDHKTTKDIQSYALTEDGLKSDVQAILYGIAARVEISRKRGCALSDVPEVDLSWGYTKTAGSRQVRAVRVRQSLALVEEHLPPILAVAADIRAAKTHAITEDLPANLDHCGAYGGCSYKDDCSAYKTRIFANPWASVDPTVANELVSLTTQSHRMTEPNVSAVLERLKNKKKAPMAPEPEVAASAPGAATPAPTQKVTSEPELAPIDASGTEAPAPEPVRLNPPDAAAASSSKTTKVAKPKAAEEPVVNLSLQEEFVALAKKCIDAGELTAAAQLLTSAQYHLKGQQNALDAVMGAG